MPLIYHFLCICQSLRVAFLPYHCRSLDFFICDFVLPLEFFDLAIWQFDAIRCLVKIS